MEIKTERDDQEDILAECRMNIKAEVDEPEPTFVEIELEVIRTTETQCSEGAKVSVKKELDLECSSSSKSVTCDSIETAGKREMDAISNDSNSNQLTAKATPETNEKKSDLMKCQYCEKSYKLRSLREHLLTAHCNEKHECEKCNKVFRCRQYLNQHVKICLDSNGNHQCDVCQKLFKNKDSLYQHGRTVHSLTFGLYKCSVCRRIFKSNILLENHVTSAHGDERHDCVQCKKVFKSKLNLDQHIRDVHTEKRYKCPICESAFKCKKSVQYHLSNIHNNESHKCDICDKVCVSKDNLDVHVKNVHMSTKVKCVICSCIFKHKRSLQSHLKSAHGQKQFKCDVCRKTFHSKLCWYSHVENEHVKKKIISKEQVFECKMCDKTFKYKRTIFMHIKSEHSINTCSYCSLEFTSVKRLKNHINKFHKYALRFECVTCKEVFINRTYVCRHIISTHCKVNADEVYTCNVCLKEYKFKANIQRHVRLNICSQYNTKTRDTVVRDNISVASSSGKIEVNEDEMCSRPEFEHVEVFSIKNEPMDR